MQAKRIKLVKQIKRLYKDEKKDKKQFEEEKIKMEKIALTRRELQKVAMIEIGETQRPSL